MQRKGNVKQTTLKEIAERAGVSIATASNVINNTRPVSHNLRLKVEKVLGEMTYQSKYKPRSRGISRLIAFVVDDMQNPYFTEIFPAAERCAKTMGYNLILVQSIKHSHNILYIKDLEDKNISGIIGFALINQEYLEELSLNIPMVLLANDPGLPFSSAVILPDEAGSFLATEYLIASGHRNIIVMGGPSKIPCFARRYKGYENAFKKNNLPFNKKNIVEIEPNFSQAFVSTKKILEENKYNITAFMTHNDISACAVMAAAREMGIRIPEDLSVVGFDNTYLTNITNPPLTSVDIPKKTVGIRLVELVVRLINGQSAPVSNIKDVKLNLRGSTAAAKEAERSKEQ